MLMRKDLIAAFHDNAFGIDVDVCPGFTPCSTFTLLHIFGILGRLSNCNIPRHWAGTEAIDRLEFKSLFSLFPVQVAAHWSRQLLPARTFQALSPSSSATW